MLGWNPEAGAPSCYLELVDKLQNWICRTVGLSLAAFLEPWAHCPNVASFSLFYKYCLGRCSSELAQVVAIPYSQGSLLAILIDCNFSVTILKCYKDVHVNSFNSAQTIIPASEILLRYHCRDHSFFLQWKRGIMVHGGTS